MPLVAVLLPAAQAPSEEPKRRAIVTKDLMMAIFDIVVDVDGMEEFARLS